MHSSCLRNPCSHICTGELKYTVVRSICTTSGPWIVLAEPWRSGEIRLKSTVLERGEFKGRRGGLQQASHSSCFQRVLALHSKYFALRSYDESCNST